LIRAVLDTNVLISGLVWGGLPGALLAAAGDRCFALMTSVYILEEAREVMERKLQLAPSFVDRSLADLCVYAAVLPVVEATRPWVGDPGDDAVVETAIAAEAHVLVTGEALLLSSDLGDLRVSTVRQFADDLGIE
jgi:putative PIN family toxin of toxin-antitoxin system